MTLSYRDATAADGPALAAMGRRCLSRLSARNFRPTTWPSILANVRTRGLAGGTGIGPRAVADGQEDGDIAGYLKSRRSSADRARTPALEIKQLYICPRQGAGVAGALMDWASRPVRRVHRRSISASGSMARAPSLLFALRLYDGRRRPPSSSAPILSGSVDAVGAVSVEAIRAAALAGLPHGFLGRRGAFDGRLRRPQVGLGSGDERALVLEIAGGRWRRGTGRGAGAGP